jgi:hypothetical protein
MSRTLQILSAWTEDFPAETALAIAIANQVL